MAGESLRHAWRRDRVVDGIDLSRVDLATLRRMWMLGEIDEDMLVRESSRRRPSAPSSDASSSWHML